MQVMDMPRTQRVQPLSLIGLFLTGLLAAGALGALTNGINGLVSPLYFVTILGWRNVDNVWLASIAQGILEGLISGSVLSLVFAAAIGIISRGSCPYRLGLRYLCGILAASFGCWMIGGLLAVLLSLLSPGFYRSAFIGVPSETDAMVKYAWVGGSIWGAQIGGVASLVLALVLFRATWRAQS